MSSATDLVVGVDVGTSGVKAAVFRADGAPCADARQPLRVGAGPGGRQEIAPEDIWDAVVASVRDAVGDRGDRVVGLGIAAASPTVLVLDPGGEPRSSARTFADASGAPTLETLRETIDEPQFRQRTGNPLALPTCSVATMRSVMAEANAPADRLRPAHLGTFLVRRLTGETVMDLTNASYTGLTAIEAPGRWDLEACKAFGVNPKTLPRLMTSTTPVGSLQPQPARALGIPPQAVVAAGAADTAAAALALGCIEHGDTFESQGTSGVLTTCLARPPAAGHAMNRSHVMPGRWLSHGAMSSTGAALEWFVETHGDGGGTLDAVLAEAAASEPGAGGVLFLPYLAGERSPVWDARARGTWLGLSLSTTRGDLARSVLEAAGFGLRQLIDLERRANDVELTQLESIGGGARSELWTRLKADITGVPFRPSAHPDAAVKGAALLGATAAGLHESPADAARVYAGTTTAPAIEPRLDLHEGIYARLFETYRGLYPRLQGAMHDLADIGEGRERHEAHRRGT